MKNKSFAKNAFFYMCKTLVQILFPIITLPYISRILGVEKIGQYNFATAYVSYFALIANLGIQTYAVRTGSEIRDDKKQLNAFANEIYGLKRERTEQQMRDAIAKGTLMKDLQWVPVKKDDLFFIEAGTIHAIGAGALVAEIQENSNLTYRLYDYDRVGKDGKKRELHIDKALDVANLKGSAEPKQPLRVLKYRQGIASELLTRCKYFEVYRMIVNTERRQKVHYRADEIAFRVLLCVNGCGTISYKDGTIPFYKGDCIFVPADSETLTIHGQAQFLDVRG